MYTTIAAIMMIFLSCLSSSAQSLDQFLWKNRLIFIMNPDVDQHGDHPQLKTFEGSGPAMKDRDVRIFIVRENEVLDHNGQAVKWIGNTVPDTFYKGIVLIGKDGGIKLKRPFVVSAEEIFDLIDSMPMRRAEMKNSIKD
ncbi:MAG: DUF4174 domain-containing protein [Flavobacteriaceae bacterium]